MVDKNFKKESMNKQERIEKIILTISNLVQYKNKTEKELLVIAEKKYSEEQFSVDDLVTNPEEKKLAKKLLNKYLESYTIEKPAERSDLAQLIYLEVLHLRFQKLLNKLTKESKGESVPLKLVETIHKNIEQVSTLKNRLGLNKQEEEVKQDPLKALNQLKQRFYKYINTHRDDFTMKCPHCAEMVLLRRRTEDYISGKHPFLLHNLLYNESLFRLVVDKKITKEEAANILYCSPDYISWVIEKHYLKENNARETDKRGD